MTSKLFDKIYGCLAGSRIGSAMGAPPEGWSMERITETYGVLDTFQPYAHYGGIWNRPPGSTEDGIERQKLMITAIMERQGRITAEDLVHTWIKVLDPEKMKYMTQPFDRDILAVAKTGRVPPSQLGEFMGFPNVNTTARSFHAIPLINACDTEGMIQDVYEIGRVYQPAKSDGFPGGVIYNAAVVEATRPDATVDSVIEEALKHASPERTEGMRRSPRELIEQALDIGRKASDPMDIRAELNEIYNIQFGPYAFSNIWENVAKALAIFAATDGNVKDSVIVSINFGRDTDCLAASAAGLAGAFLGTSTIPPEWIETVDQATTQNPYTNAQRTIREAAEGLYGALQNKLKKMKAHVELMESQF
jgi:ADP-ribosylglycohydrolase